MTNEVTSHPAYRLVADLARLKGELIARRAATSLRKMREPLLSGEDSALRNVWQEICAQVQGEESFFWEAYMDVMLNVAYSQVARLKPTDLRMLWMCTEEGWSWMWDVVNADSENAAPEHPGIDEEAIAVHVVNEFLIPLAEQDGNKNVKRFLARMSDM